MNGFRLKAKWFLLERIQSNTRQKEENNPQAQRWPIENPTQKVANAEITGNQTAQRWPISKSLMQANADAERTGIQKAENEIVGASDPKAMTGQARDLKGHKTHPLKSHTLSYPPSQLIKGYLLSPSFMEEPRNPSQLPSPLSSSLTTAHSTPQSISPSSSPSLPYLLTPSSSTSSLSHGDHSAEDRVQPCTSGALASPYAANFSAQANVAHAGAAHFATHANPVAFMPPLFAAAPEGACSDGDSLPAENCPSLPSAPSSAHLITLTAAPAQALTLVLPTLSPLRPHAHQ